MIWSLLLATGALTVLCFLLKNLLKDPRERIPCRAIRYMIDKHGDELKVTVLSDHGYVVYVKDEQETVYTVPYEKLYIK